LTLYVQILLEDIGCQTITHGVWCGTMFEDLMERFVCTCFCDKFTNEITYHWGGWSPGSLSHIRMYKLTEVELFKKLKLLHFQGISPPLHPQGHLIPFTHPYLNGHSTTTPKALRTNVVRTLMEDVCLVQISFISLIGKVYFHTCYYMH
jgi:hypothetical protein